MWKTKDGRYKDTAFAQFDTFCEGMFQRERLLDILKNFILFSGDAQRPVKILAGYHQYFAVRKAVEKAVTATFIGFTSTPVSAETERFFVSFIRYHSLVCFFDSPSGCLGQEVILIY